MKCERCGVLYLGNPSHLVGGRVAGLCASCQTEWDTFIKGQPIWDEYRRLATCYDAALHRGDEQAALMYLAEMPSMEAELFRLSGEWLLGGSHDQDSS